MSLVGRRKAAVAILILDLLDDDKGSERSRKDTRIDKEAKKRLSLLKN